MKKEDKKCNGGNCTKVMSGITKITFIEPTDIKSFMPFKMKRKYGKFKREIHTYIVENDK